MEGCPNHRGWIDSGKATMKLLGWMNRKFRQNGGDTVAGQAAQDDHRRLSYGPRPLKLSEIDHLRRKSFAGIDAVKIEFCGDEGQLTAAIDGLFHGFLTIGTLGSEPSAAAEEATPTFELSVTDDIPVLEILVEDEAPALELSVEEVVEEKETEITENELNLINEELEKALTVVGPDEDGSSGRNSYVSAGRSSHANGGATTVCPLQGYLLGSAAEVQGIKDGDAGPKKEPRTTLGELFRMTDEESKEESVKKGGGWDDADAPSVGKFPKKKRMMKKFVQAVSASKGSFGNSSTNTATSSETKLHKILHMFQKKVHPENGMTLEKSPGKLKKVTFAAEVENKGGKRDVGGRGICSQAMIQPEDIKKVLVKEKTLRMKCQDGELPQAAMDGNESNGSRECWIKTDEDYLVLEL